MAESWVEVKDRSGKLLFKIDPKRALVQVQLRRVKSLVDLTEYGLRPATSARDPAKGSG